MVTVTQQALFGVPEPMVCIKTVVEKREEVTEAEEKEAKVKKAREAIRDSIFEEAKKGNLVFNTFDGLMIAPFEDIIKQPIEGLLYDVNRDLVTISSFLNDPKWINDYALTTIVLDFANKLEKANRVVSLAQEFVKASDSVVESEDYFEDADIIEWANAFREVLSKGATNGSSAKRNG